LIHFYKRVSEDVETSGEDLGLQDSFLECEGDLHL